MKFSTLTLCLIGAAIAGITSAQNVVEVEEDRYLSLVDDTSMSMSMPIAEEVVVEEETTPWKVKPKPFPSNYRLLTSMDPSDEDTIYGYTFAVAGEDASLTSHTVSGVSDEDSTLYFKLQDMGTCNRYTETSFQVSRFNVFDYDEGDDATDFFGREKSVDFFPTVIQKTICWKAPAKHHINEGVPRYHRLILQILNEQLTDNYINDWVYDGTILTIQGKADVWKKEKEGCTTCRSLLTLLRSSGEVMKYNSRYVRGAESVDFALDIIEYEEYDNPGDVPNAFLTDEEKESCQVMILPSYNYKECVLDCPEENLLEAAQNAVQADLGKQGLGLVLVEDNDIYNSFPSFPSTSKEYQMLGDEEDMAEINELKSFVPGMKGRSMQPVRQQGLCGSCSFAAAHSISSAYNKANPNLEEDAEFANQHIMNCFPLGPLLLADEDGNLDVEDLYIDSGSGCWGGNVGPVIDMLVASGPKLPLRVTEPYIGMQGHCDMSRELVDIGLTGYSPITTVEEMKNALAFRGDVAAMINAGATQTPDELDGVQWPSNDISLHETATLNSGNSFSSSEPPNHAITIVGWGPCTVNHCLTDEIVEEAECWIVQNSWGVGHGYEGMDFVHTDLDCDGGIVSNGGAIIPLVVENGSEVQVMGEEEAANTSSGCGSGVSKSKYYLAVVMALSTLLQ